MAAPTASFDTVLHEGIMAGYAEGTEDTWLLIITYPFICRCSVGPSAYIDAMFVVMSRCYELTPCDQHGYNTAMYAKAIISSPKELQNNVTPEDMAHARHHLVSFQDAYASMEATMCVAMGAATYSRRVRYALNRTMDAVELLTDQEHQLTIRWTLILMFLWHSCVIHFMGTLYVSSSHRCCDQ